MDEIKTKIRSFLARFFKQVHLQDDQDFFALGFVNSLFAMQLVLFVEKEFGLSIENEDLDIDNFKSIDAIVHLVMQKMVAQQAHRS
jgi:acyl carrier protein